MAHRSTPSSKKNRNPLLLSAADSRFLFEKLETRQLMSTAVLLASTDLSERISRFETTVTRQVENHLKLANSPRFENLIIKEQQHFAALIGSEGGTYTPIDYTSLVATATTDKANALTELRTTEITNFQTKLLKQVHAHPHLWNNAHFQHQIAVEQTKFAALIAKQGGTYTPVPFSDLILGTLPPVVSTNPNIPTLSTTAVLANEIDLAWTTVTGALAYVLQQSADGGTTWTTLATFSGNSYPVTGLQANKSYQFTIAAITSAGTQTASSPFIVSTLLNPPTGFAGSATTATNVHLTWAAVTGAASYKIERATNPSTWTTIAAAATGTSYNDATVVAATSYFYRISATETAGTSVPSTVITVTTRPVAPVLVATPISATEIDLSWGTVSTAYSYLLETSLNNVKWTTLATLPGLTYAHTALAANSTHYYRVSAINGSGVSAASTVVSKTTFLGQPTGLTARATSSTAITVSWIPVTGAVTYKLEREPAGGSSWTVVSSSILHSVSSYADTGLSGGTQYSYRLSSINAVGTSVVSGTVSATTLVASPIVTGTVTSATAISLSWPAVTGATGYKVETSANGGTTWTTLAANQAGLTYNHTGLAPNSTHKYRVSAIGPAGTSAPSSPVTTLVTYTAAPAGITANATFPTGVHLTWTAVPGATSYKLERMSTGSPWAALVPSTPFTGTTTSYNDTTVSPGVAYSYRLSSIVNTVTSSPTTAATATTYPVAPTVTATNVSSSALNLGWTAVTGATGYMVEESVNAGATWSTLAASQTTLTYAVSGLSADSPYQFRVTTIGTAGDSAGTVLSQTTALPAPTNFGASIIAPASVHLVWTPVADVATYKLERQISGGAWSVVSSNISNTAVTYDDGTAAAGTTYGYRLSAVNSNGSSTPALSTPATILTLPATSTVTATAASATSITVNWTAVPTATSYVLKSSTDGGTTWNQLTLPSPTVLTYTATATADTSYKFQVTAVNGSGSGVPGVSAAVKTLLAPPANFAAAVTSASTVTLTWTAETDATGYKVERSVGGTTWSTLSTISSGTTATYADATIAAGTNYTYRLSSINAQGTSATETVTALTLPAIPVLTAVANSVSQITLTWAAVTSASSYTLTYSPDSGTTWHTLLNSNALTFVHTGLVVDTSYMYRLTANNTTGSSASTGTGSVTMSTLLAPPTNFSVVDNSATSVTLTWTPVTHAVTYKIERQTAGGAWATLATPAGTVGTYADTTVGSTSYGYRISAVDAAGTSLATAPITILTVPVAPTVTATLISATQINLSWNASTGATSYRVDQYTSGSWLPIASVTTTTFQNTGLTPDTAYQYRVYAINAGGLSAASNTTASITTYLAAPSGFTATVSNSSTGVVLGWTAVTDATKYKIDRSTDNLTWNSTFNINSGSTVTYTDTTATPGAQYFYRIAAIDAVGTSAESNSVGAFTYATTPTGLTETLLSPTTAQLNWNASAGAHSYYIEDYVNSNWSSVTSVSTTTYNITGLTAGNTYQYRVSATDAAGTSAPSSAVSINTPLATPTGFNAAPISATSVSIVWTAVANATGYKIERSADDVNWTTISASASLVGTDNIATDTVSGGTQYWYRISSNSAGGYSAPSSSVSVLTVPVAPTIAGTVFSATQINLSWNTVPGATSYTISYYNSSNSTYSPISPEPVGDVSSFSTAVAPDTEYAFVIQANDATGASAYGTIANSNAALILTTPLAAPSLTATPANNASSISLAWPAIADATNYLLQRSTDQTSWTTLTQTGGWNSSSAGFTDSTVSTGTTYYYRLSAIDAAGNSAFATANALTIPSQPVITGTAASATQLNLSWGAVATATSYTLAVSDGNGGWTNVSPQPSGTATSISITGLTADTSYSYELIAHNATGPSTAGTVTLSTILPAPASFTASPTSATSVTLGFTAAAHASSYVLQRSPDGNIWSTITQTLGPTDTTFVDTGLSAGTKYYYRMAAVNTAGTSSWSTANVVTLPAAPVLTESGATSTSVTLAWNLVKSATSYTLEVEGSNSTYAPAANQPTGAVTSFTVPGLTADTAYSYELVANDLIGGNTESSAASTALAVSTTLAAPVLSASTATSTTVTLNWTAIAHATSYVLQRSIDNTIWTSITNSLGASDNTFTDTGLTPGTTYYYKLAAVDAAGTSAAASTSVITTPAAPTLNVDVVSDTSLLLSWSASPNATGYVVEAATVTNGNTSWAAITPQPTGTSTTLSITGLTSDTAYTYEVFAADASGNSPASNSVVGTTFITAPTFTATAASSTSVTLAFTANADAIGYLVERSDDGGAIWNPITNTLGPTSTTYTDTGLTPGTTYQYRLSAISASGTGAPFGPITVTTDPDAPVLTGVAASSSEIDLNWTPVQSATGYTLNVNTSNGWTAVSTQPVGTATSIALTGLNSGTTYSYQIFATNGSLTSAASQTLSVSTLLGPPTTLTYGATTNTSVVLNWTAVNLATSYVIQQSTDQTTWTTLSPNSTITGTTYTDNTVVPGTTYYYRIAANNSQGISDWYNAQTAVTTPLNAPTGLTATVNSATQITLNWTLDTDPGLTGYRLEISTDGTTYTTVATITNTLVTSAIDSGLTTATAYHYRLFALSAGGDSAPSTAVVATTN